MKYIRIIAILLPAIALSSSAVAKDSSSFRPQTANVLGTVNAGTPIPMTQVVTQLAGELSIKSTDEDLVNFAPNWSKLARVMLSGPQPVVAHTTIVWGDEVIRITCYVDIANSNLVRGHLRIIMEATEGTRGSVEIGTIVAVIDGQLYRQRGVFGLKNHIEWTPGVFPDILPTAWTSSTQTVPGIWKTGSPGRVVVMCTFTSIQPPDGSPPRVYTSRMGIPIQ